MTRTKKTYKNIEAFIKGLPQERQDLAKGLLRELRFMDETLEELKADIKERGVTIDGVGSTGQSTSKTNPSLSTYNVVIKNFNSTIRQLADLLPDGAKTEKDALLSYIQR